MLPGGAACRHHRRADAAPAPLRAGHGRSGRPSCSSGPGRAHGWRPGPAAFTIDAGSWWRSPRYDGPPVGDARRAPLTVDRSGGPSRPPAVRPGRAPQLVQRELGGLVAAALGTVLDVAPGAQQPGALGIEQDDERLRDGVDLEPVIGAPRGGGVMRIERQALQHPAEAELLGVEDPRAVAGLEDVERVFCGGDHETSMPAGSRRCCIESGSSSLRNSDNLYLRC